MTPRGIVSFLVLLSFTAFVGCTQRIGDFTMISTKNVDNCIESGKGDLLTNAVIESTFWWAIVWGEQKYTATGDVWVKAGTSDLLESGIRLYELQGTPSGYQLVSTSDPSQSVKVDYLLSQR